MKVMRGDRKHAEAESTDGAGGGTLGRRSVLGGLAAIPVLSSIAGPAAAALAATGARNDLRDGLGPEFADFEIEALNPKRLAHKHLFGDLNADQPEQARQGDCPIAQDEVTATMASHPFSLTTAGRCPDD